MPQMLDFPFPRAPAAFGADHVKAPADSEANQRRNHEQDRLGYEQADHFSRATRTSHVFTLF